MLGLGFWGIWMCKRRRFFALPSNVERPKSENVNCIITKKDEAEKIMPSARQMKNLK